MKFHIESYNFQKLIINNKSLNLEILMEKENRLNTLNSESSFNKSKHYFITQEKQSPISQQKQSVKFRISCLQAQLKNVKDREIKLRVTNTQLSNMLLTSNQNSSTRTSQYIQKIEDMILGKIKVQYRDSLIDQKINSITKDSDPARSFEKRERHSKGHGRAISNFSTLNSFPSRDLYGQEGLSIHKFTKKDIRDRIDSVKRIQKQLQNGK